jgi:Flp pilus assembly protein TadD
MPASLVRLARPVTTTRPRSLAARLVAVLVMLAVAGCGGLYSGKPEKLSKPSKKKEPDAVVAVVEIKWANECAAKLNEEPGTSLKTHKKNEARVKQIAAQAQELLDAAASASDNQQKAGQTTEAIDKLRKALVDAPYSAEATYSLAVGYARSRRKGCALAMLKRLAQLEKYEDFAVVSKRLIGDALDNAEFQPFRKDADEALGR